MSFCTEKDSFPREAAQDFPSSHCLLDKLSQASTTASRLSSDCSFTEKERTTNLINNSCQVPSGPLGIKLQITIDDETDAEAFPKCHYLWSTNVGFSPVSDSIFCINISNVQLQ